MKQLEAAISKKIATRLRARGFLVKKLTMLGPYGTRGWPDLLVVPKDDSSFFIEVKRPGKDLEPHQVRRVKKLRDQGQDVLVASSVEPVLEFVA